MSESYLIQVGHGFGLAAELSLGARYGDVNPPDASPWFSKIYSDLPDAE
jgi:hypothetical protein